MLCVFLYLPHHGSSAVLKIMDETNANRPDNLPPYTYTVYTFWKHNREEELNSIMKSIYNSGIGVVLVGSIGDSQVAILQAIKRNDLFDVSGLNWIFFNHVESQIDDLFPDWVPLANRQANMAAHPARGVFFLTPLNDLRDLYFYNTFEEKWDARETYRKLKAGEPVSTPETVVGNQIAAYLCASVMVNALVKYIESAPSSQQNKVAMDLTNGDYSAGAFNLSFIQNLTLPNSPYGDLRFDENGDVSTGYLIYNWGVHGPRRFMRFLNENLLITNSRALYAGGSADPGPDYRTVQGKPRFCILTRGDEANSISHSLLSI
jgi:hypothetical protein